MNTRGSTQKLFEKQNERKQLVKQVQLPSNAFSLCQFVLMQILNLPASTGSKAGLQLTILSPRWWEHKCAPHNRWGALTDDHALTGAGS